MQPSGKIAGAAITGVIALAAIALSGEQTKQTESVKGDMERCYGIAKPGANDCASASGSHDCAGKAEIPANTDDWIALPKGTCAKLVGGRIG